MSLSRRVLVVNEVEGCELRVQVQDCRSKETVREIVIADRGHATVLLFPDQQILLSEQPA